LAQDVERYLHDEPVQAGPPSAWYRFRKLARRNRRLLITAGAFLLLLVASVVGLAIGLVAIDQAYADLLVEQERTTNALEREKEARAEEVKRRNQARDALDAATLSLFTGDWSVLTGEGRPGKPVFTEAQKTFLLKALEAYEGFAAELGEDQEIRVGAAKAYMRLSILRYNLYDKAEAVPAYQHTRDLYAKLVADFPDVPEHRRQLAETTHVLSHLLKDTDRPLEADKAYRDAIAIQQQLVADFPTVAEYRQVLDSWYRGLAGEHDNTRRYQELVSLRREVLAFEKELADRSPDNPEHKKGAARACADLSAALRIAGRPQEAEAVFGEVVTFHREVLALEKQRAARAPDNPEQQVRVIHAHGPLRVALQGAGQPQEAEAVNQEGFALTKQLVTGFPKVAEYRLLLAERYRNQAHDLTGAGRHQAAVAAHREGIALEQKVASDFPDNPEYKVRLAGAYAQLGTALRKAARPQEAETAHREGIAVHQKLADDFPRNPEYRAGLMIAHAELGTELHNAGQAQEAETAHREALAVEKQLAAQFPDSPEHRMHLPSYYTGLGSQHGQLRRSQEAETAFRRAIALQTQLAEDFPLDYGVRSYLASIHDDRTRVIGTGPAAETAYRDALAVHEQLADDFPDKPRGPHVTDLQRWLAERYFSTGRPEEGVTAYREALAVFRQLAAGYPGWRSQLAATHSTLGDRLKKCGRGQEAEQEYRRALATVKHLAAEFPREGNHQSEQGRYLHKLAEVLQARNEPAEARQLLERAVAHWRAGIRLEPQNGLNDYGLLLARVCRDLGTHEELAGAALDLRPPPPQYRSGRDGEARRRPVAGLVCGAGAEGRRADRREAQGADPAVRRPVRGAARRGGRHRLRQGLLPARRGPRGRPRFRAAPVAGGLSEAGGRSGGQETVGIRVG
jgi:tetratricopeptide (TPR) repeat protein